MTLRALQSAANNSNSEAPMSWRALNATGAQMGSPTIDYDRFAAQWDAEDETGVLHQLVDRFDGNGLVIKTNAQGAGQPQQGGQEGEAASAISTMAKRATKLGK